MIEGHGNDKYRYGGRVEIDFSSNIAYNHHAGLIIEHLRERLTAIENYPDPTTQVLCRKIAKRYDIESHSVMVCNGSAEAFYLVAHHIARAGAGIGVGAGADTGAGVGAGAGVGVDTEAGAGTGGRARSLVFTPSFAEYEDSCRVYNHQVEFARLTQFGEIDYSTYDSVWIGTPNNPDGYRVSIREIEQVAKRYPTCCFVVDRAYNDLSASCDELSEGAIPANLLLIHSLTKTFGIPGIRLGYIVAAASSIEQLKALRPPWSVNALSLEAGEFVMDNYDRLSVDTEELLEASKYLQRELAKLGFLEVVPSDTNFLLCRLIGRGSAEELHQYLIDQHGILIRNASNFKGLTPEHFRIAAQGRADNNRLIEALRKWR